MTKEVHSYSRRMRMFKMIGGLLIVLACTSLGVEKSKELSRHRRELEELLQIFTFIQVRMECLKLPFDL